MRLQSLLVVALALVFGGSAAVGVRSFLNGRGTAARRPTPSRSSWPSSTSLAAG